MRVIFIVLVTSFLSLPSYAASYGPYALIAPVAIDGDTLRADVLIWPDIIAEASIRVAGVDTPELAGNGTRAIPPCEKVLAATAKDFTQAWIRTHQPLTIKNVQSFKYGIGAVVVGSDQTLLANALLESGHARPYSGGARQPWCQ